MQGARLLRASLVKADFRHANLAGADLRRVHASDANFEDAILRGAQVTQASLDGAHVCGADFDGAIGLDTLHATSLFVEKDLSRPPLDEVNARAWLQRFSHSVG